MGFDTILFWLFAAVLLGSASLVVLARSTVHAALFLVLAFFNSAGLWLLLEAEFLAIALVLVYVGAVMVLFLFVIMMLDLKQAPLREGFMRFLPVGLGVGAIIAMEMVLVVGRGGGPGRDAEPARAMAEYSNTEAIGNVLYTVYLYPFEIAAVILLVAIVAAIALTLRRRAGVRVQDPARQHAARAADRVRLVQVPSERPDPTGRSRPRGGA